MTRARREDLAFGLALFFFALAPRLFVALHWAGEPVWDGHYYDFGARRIAAGFGYSDDRWDAGVPQRGQGVRREVRVHAGRHVGQRADLERQPRPDEFGNEFGRRYWAALQRDPAVVIAHGRMMGVLNSNS